MHLLLGLLGFVLGALLGLALLVSAVVATHPWLAVGALAGSVQVVDDRPAPVRAGVPSDQWPLIASAAQQSTCAVSAEDLAAIAQVESNFGAQLLNPRSGAFGYGQFDAATWAAFGSGNPDSPADALPAIARTLCARGYGVDRTAALNSYGGCLTPMCLGNTDYATAITDVARGYHLQVSVTQVAEQWLGVPYVFGGCSTHGVDCSCLVELIYQRLGINLPRTAAEQFAATTRLSPDQLQPGDLVFFANTYMPGISHVGIYIGNRQQINAPTEGQSVSIQPVFDGYWGAHYAGAGRVTK
ncbi:MAG: C40 family peptidase [Chloroflexi bacterium]|nr:C40 family peptidase [Chloroflexota bacterium]